MPSYVTKAHFDGAMARIDARFDGFGKKMDARFEGLVEVMKQNTREIIGHFNASQGLQNERMEQGFAQVDIKLDAILDITARRSEVRSLIRALNSKGIAIAESDILTA